MLKENVVYHIFRVYDYKGGELRARVNLSKDSFLGSIADVFEGAFWDEEEEDNDEPAKLETSKLINKLKKYISSEDFYTTYAGSGGYVGEIYYTENDKLINIGLEDTLEDVAEYIKKNWH